MRASLPLTFLLLAFFLPLLSIESAQAQGEQYSEEILRLEYSRIRSIATQLAGNPGDIPNRVNELHKIYLDSEGNHVFPQVALHGALWAYGYFEAGGVIAQIISYRYFYDEEERLRRLEMLEEFAESFKATNRLVFIDTYTNYYFSKYYGQSPYAQKIIPIALLSMLNLMHQYRKNHELMPQNLRKELFKMALLWEQENSVAPSVAKAVEKFNCPILKRLALSPVVRFSYFPINKVFVFRNFADKQERIKYALESYELAEQVGWDQVQESVLEYGVPGVHPQI